MEKYGLTARRIRIDKGLLMKEVYGGIVGRTFAYRFERGEVNLALEDFLSVLDNLELENPDEFFFLHYGEKYRGQKSFLKEIAEETQRFQHVEKEPKFYLKYKDSKKKEERFYAYLIHLLATIDRIDAQTSEVNTEEMKFMEDYLMQMETWTLKEMNNASIILPMLADDIRPLFLSRFKKNYQNYRDFEEDWSFKYANHLLNYALIQLLFDRYEEALSLVPDLQTLVKEHPSLQGRLVITLRLSQLELIAAVFREDDDFIRSETQRIQTICDLCFLDEEVRMAYPRITAEHVKRARVYKKQKEKKSTHP
ncbi:transcriptional regulator [Enterococcus faecium]|uniref:Rgg family transcriptional regulator n=1 Tax=Enterococcus TaxID=1350 RepID=UPI000A34BE59|nr:MULTISPECIES: transcriptional regulator [Enterococcus]EGP4760172.1 transcriptional regulator [Enterococcus faecium]EGP4982440.1 transcriptional regulator [Enterococcus faecium]EGP5416838.1 transcriptional regulator [Enterococcus faecium]EGP5712786.1 transcriptional regulator [Enterococcus faecium]EGP5719560.1 transcriptional regulator [Enterococcus faecium]